MKKLLCLVIVMFLFTGCSSNSSNKDVKEDKKVAENSKTNKDKQKESTKSKEDKKDEPSSKETNVSKQEVSSTTENKTTNSNSGKSTSSNNNSNISGGSATPPKQETPTPPKEETPPPAPAMPVEQRAKADSVMAQINAYRLQNGKPAFLVTNYLLDKSSKHAYAMANARALWHSGAAECITNYDDPFSAWVNSPDHNALLLSNNETGAVSIYYVDGYYYSVFQTLP